MKFVGCCALLVTLYVAGVLLFMKGFLLKRIVISDNSSCSLGARDDGDRGHPNSTEQHFEQNGCWMPRRFNRTIFIIIDALRFDFVAPYNPPSGGSESGKVAELPFHNKLSTLTSLLRERPNNARLYHFEADPPTTTLQRLKGLTTGSLPTFVDAGANFASAEISEDNLIDQFVRCGKNVTFMGDDTWQSLFPGRFSKSFPFPSFNVKDLDTVDSGIARHLVPEVKNRDWEVLISHFLGVDHCGHTFGPYHPRMAIKLAEMDAVLRFVELRKIQSWQALCNAVKSNMLLVKEFSYNFKFT